jgi:hypothetical protein
VPALQILVDDELQRISIRRKRLIAAFNFGGFARALSVPAIQDHAVENDYGVAQAVGFD